MSSSARRQALDAGRSNAGAVTCPRCGASAYDEAIDPARTPIASGKSALIGWGGCLAVLLAIPTLGLSFVVFGMVAMASDARGLTQRAELAAEAAAATRRTCRACSLAWYEPERAELEARFAPAP